MLNGARFLGSGLGNALCAPIVGRYRAKVIGNGLRELDRFLSVLLDEIALAAGWSGQDFEALAKLHDTAEKLRSVHARLDLPARAYDRLRALARCRDNLFYSNGVVRRGDTRRGRILTLGWPVDGTDEGAAVVLALGDDLVVGAAELAWICGFYTRIADRLVAGQHEVPQRRRRSEALPDRPRAAPAGRRRPPVGRRVPPVRDVPFVRDGL